MRNESVYMKRSRLYGAPYVYNHHMGMSTQHNTGD